MIYTHGMRPETALNDRVADAVTDLTGLLPRLEEEIPEKHRALFGGAGSSKGGHHPLASWNSGAAMLVMEIHAGARELETNLRYAAAGVIRGRGGSDGNTAVSLSNLVSLCAGADYHAVMTTVRKLEQWAHRARLILGDTEPVSRLPRLPGQGDPACPFCNRKGTLRVRHSTGVVTCLHPMCRDSNGDRPAGRIEMGAYSGEPILAWRDGTAGVAVRTA